MAVGVGRDVDGALEVAAQGGGGAHSAGLGDGIDGGVGGLQQLLGAADASGVEPLQGRGAGEVPEVAGQGA
jgi:hypothetical protein